MALNGIVGCSSVLQDVYHLPNGFVFQAFYLEGVVVSE